jgi:hypothetical protein
MPTNTSTISSVPPPWSPARAWDVHSKTRSLVQIHVACLAPRTTHLAKQMLAQCRIDLSLNPPLTEIAHSKVISKLLNCSFVRPHDPLTTHDPQALLGLSLYYGQPVLLHHSIPQPNHSPRRLCFICLLVASSDRSSSLPLL